MPSKCYIEIYRKPISCMQSSFTFLTVRHTTCLPHPSENSSSIMWQVSQLTKLLPVRWWSTTAPAPSGSFLSQLLCWRATTTSVLSVPVNPDFKHSIGRSRQWYTLGYHFTEDWAWRYREYLSTKVLMVSSFNTNKFSVTSAILPKLFPIWMYKTTSSLQILASSLIAYTLWAIKKLS